MKSVYIFIMILILSVITGCAGSSSSNNSKSGDATLKEISGVLLNPSFKGNITSYSAIVENIITSAAITAVANDSKAIVTGGGLKNLNVGENEILLTSTAEDGTKLTYRIVIIRREKPLQPDINDSKAVAEDKKLLTDSKILGQNSSLLNVVSDLNLPLTGDNGSTIKWTSTNETVVSLNGKVIRSNENDISVVLTAKITKGNISEEKIFNIIVIKNSVIINTLGEIWVDPVNGSDTNSGKSRKEALKSMGSAWRMIPGNGQVLEKSYHIMLTAGDYPESLMADNNWYEGRHGSEKYPIIIEAVDGDKSAKIHAYFNINDCRYVQIKGLSFITERGYGGGSNVIHIEKGENILIKNCKLNGFDGVENQPQETVKVNQSKYIYIEDCEISGAGFYGIDFVATQYGHIKRNRVHDVADHGIMLKGGSAYFLIEGNEVYNCENSGLAAGQTTGFVFMVSPWIHYEAYDLKFVNNIVHDTNGAGISVIGGYNILMAYNTMSRVGKNSFVIGVLHGGRVYYNDKEICQNLINQGGWGYTDTNAITDCIPNKNIFIYNNIVYNPAGYSSQWAHFRIEGEMTPTAGGNLPSPSKADDNLQIKGNIIWNGGTDNSLSLGAGSEGEGGQAANPTCNATQLVSENRINSIEPKLDGNYKPVVDISSNTTYDIPDFTWSDAPSKPVVPAGNISNNVANNYEGKARTLPGNAGAF